MLGEIDSHPAAGQARPSTAKRASTAKSGTRLGVARIGVIAPRPIARGGRLANETCPFILAIERSAGNRGDAGRAEREADEWSLSVNKRDDLLAILLLVAVWAAVVALVGLGGDYALNDVAAEGGSFI